MVTLKEIARRAQVSAATVSHVLNGTARISDETRQRVMDIVRELNYTPNSIAKSLKTRKSSTLGIITEDITVFHTPEIINGINEYAEEHGYHMLLNNIRLYHRIGNNYRDTGLYQAVIQDTKQVLLGNQVDGIIYVGSHCRDVSGILGAMPRPAVFVYCQSGEQGTASVNYDDAQAAFDATHHLIAHGHRRIAVITGRYDSMQSQLRLQGFTRAMAAAGVPVNPDFVRAGDWEYASGVRVGEELLALPEPPTAVFAMNDLMAGGVLEAAGTCGVAVPEALSVIGFDNRECSSAYLPRLTTMALPLNEMGKMAASMLISRIQEPEIMASPAQSLHIRCTLTGRATVAAVL